MLDEEEEAECQIESVGSPSARPATGGRILAQTKATGPTSVPLAKEDEQEDSVYQFAEVARLSAEMPRADISGEDWGAYDVETLRIAGLCRTVLIRLNYCHVCTPLYCLKGAANISSSV